MKRNSSKPKRRYGDAGFTLVELVVVIAVLAILAGVGAVAYSGYIDYTHKGVDRQTVGEIIHALELANYDDPDVFKNGALVLVTQNAGTKTTDAMKPALERALGDLSAVKLVYDGWDSPGAGDISNIIDALKDAAGTGKFTGNVGSYIEELQKGGLTASYTGHTDELMEQVAWWVDKMNNGGLDLNDPNIHIGAGSNDYLHKAISYSNTYKDRILSRWTGGTAFNTSDHDSLPGESRFALELARNQAFYYYAKNHSGYNEETMGEALEALRMNVQYSYCEADGLDQNLFKDIISDYVSTGQAVQDAHAFLGVMETANVIEQQNLEEGKDLVGDDVLMPAVTQYDSLLDNVFAGSDLDTLSALTSSSSSDGTTVAISATRRANGTLNIVVRDKDADPRKDGEGSTGDTPPEEVKYTEDGTQIDFTGSGSITSTQTVVLQPNRTVNVSVDRTINLNGYTLDVDESTPGLTGSISGDNISITSTSESTIKGGKLVFSKTSLLTGSKTTITINVDVVG